MDFSKITSLTKHEFVRGSAALAAGDFSSKLLGFLGMLLLVRLYTPSQLGIWTALTSAASLTMIASTFKLEQALPIPEEEGEAAEVLIACLGLVALWGVVFVVLYFVITPAASRIEGFFAPVLAFVVFSSVGIQQVYVMWAVRLGEFKRQATARVVQIAATLAAQIALGLTAASATGLVVGDATGRVSSCGILMSIRWQRLIDTLRAARFSQVARRVREYIRFPIYTMPAAALQAAIVTSPPIVLTYFYGSATAGYWAVAQYFAAGVAVANIALGPVFYNQSSRLVREDPQRLRRLFWRVFTVIVSFGTACVVVLLFAAPDLVAFLFGEKWRHAGVFLQIFAPALVCNLAGCFWESLSAFGKQSGQTTSFAGGFVVLVVGFAVVATQHLGDVYAVAVISASTCVAYITSAATMIRAVESAAAARKT